MTRSALLASILLRNRPGESSAPLHRVMSSWRLQHLPARVFVDGPGQLNVWLCPCREAKHVMYHHRNAA